MLIIKTSKTTTDKYFKDDLKKQIRKRPNWKSSGQDGILVEKIQK